MKIYRAAVSAFLGIALLACLAWWFFYRSYLRETKNLLEGITGENYYQILGPLSHLPKTRVLLDIVPRPTVTGDVKTSVDYGSREGIEAQITFPKIENFHDAEERSSRIFITLPRPIDFSKTILMTKVRAWGNVILGNHLSSRLQFELYDANGRVLRGPKAVAKKAGQDFVLVVRPTVEDPIPTGFADPQFDVTKVTEVAVRFMLGVPRTAPTQSFRGKLHLGEILIIRDLDLITNFFPAPDKNRITNDRFDLPYELHRRGWRKEEKEFFVGINYPWRNYDWDFGRNPWGSNPPRDGWAAHEDELLRNFMRFRESGITHVRIYMFTSFRSGLLETNKGYALDQYVFEDVEAMLRAAERANIKLIPVLFDFGIGNTIASEYTSKGKPELIFSPRKYQLFVQVMIPLFRKLETLNTQYGKPIEYLELMNEPDNMALLIVPGYYESLKNWLTDLAVVIHEETSIKITLGSRSFADFKKWWNGIPVDAYQFHFYTDMTTDMPPVAVDVPRKELNIGSVVFCGELDPYRMEENIPRLKERGYDGALLWSFDGRDGFEVDLDALSGIVQKLHGNVSENKSGKQKQVSPSH